MKKPLAGCEMRILLIFFLVLTASSSAQIVLSEIMFNPSGSERTDEFVEIYNLSTADTIDVGGWLLSDSSGFNRIAGHSMGSRIPPQSYAMILVPNYYLQSNYYARQIPPACIQLTIDKAQLGSYGLNNSRGETVSLHRPDTSLVGRFTYTVPNEEGISEEKIDLSAGDQIGNWRHSLYKDGTPGGRNSVSLLAHDLAFDARGVHQSPMPAPAGDSLKLEAWVYNRGLYSAGSFFVSLFRDVNGDGEPQPAESLMTTKPHPETIAPFDSALAVFRLSPSESGVERFWIFLYYKPDEDLNNNEMEIEWPIVAALPALRVNEIFYNTGEKIQEWVEIFNPGPANANLQGCLLRDTHKSVMLTTAPFMIPTDGFCVLSNVPLAEVAGTANLVQPSLPELNNSGDEVVLLDPSGRCVDSVAYVPQWGGGRDLSLERIRWEDGSNDPANWASCQDVRGATPGWKNSCSPAQMDAAIVPGSLSFSPARFVQGQPVRLSCMVENAGRDSLKAGDVHFYLKSTDTAEEIGAVTFTDLAARQQLSVGCDWLEPPGGLVTVCARAMTPGDQRPENNEQCSPVTGGYGGGMLMINEIMYSPAEGAPEWIECFNPHGAAVDLCGWTISDSDTSNRRSIADSPCPVPAGGYLILAAHPDYEDFAGLTPQLPDSWPSLGNSGDRIVLYDATGHIVDEVSYWPQWGGAAGRSLERLSPSQPSSTPGNWATCVDNSGHTAGRRNSVYFDVLPARVRLRVEPVPFSPDGDGREDHLAIGWDLPIKTAAVNLRIFDSAGRLVRLLCNNEPSGSNRTVFWDGRDAAGQRCRIGLYIIHLEAFDAAGGSFLQEKKVCVLAGRL